MLLNKILRILLATGFLIIFIRILTVVSFAFFFAQNSWAWVLHLRFIPSIEFGPTDFATLQNLTQYSDLLTFCFVLSIFIYNLFSYTKHNFTKVTGWFLGFLISQWLIITAAIENIQSTLSLNLTDINYTKISLLLTFIATVMYLIGIIVKIFSKPVLTPEEIFNNVGGKKSSTFREKDSVKESDEWVTAQKTPDENFDESVKKVEVEVITPNTKNMDINPETKHSIFNEIFHGRKISKDNILRDRRSTIKISGLKGDSITERFGR